MCACVTANRIAYALAAEDDGDFMDAMSHMSTDDGGGGSGGDNLRQVAVGGKDIDIGGDGGGGGGVLARKGLELTVEDYEMDMHRMFRM